MWCVSQPMAVSMGPSAESSTQRCYSCGRIIRAGDVYEGEPFRVKFCIHCGRLVDGGNLVSLDAVRAKNQDRLAKDWAQVRSDICGAGALARITLRAIERVVAATQRLRSMWRRR